MKNYLHQRSKSLLAFAVGLTILSSSLAGEVYADEGYIDWNDIKNDSNTTMKIKISVPMETYRWQTIIQIHIS